MPTLADIGAAPLTEIPGELHRAARGIPLRSADGTIRAFAIVDADDYQRFSQFRWFINDNGYAMRYAGGRPPKRRHIRLHREVLGLGPGKDDPRRVDHINRDRLDCRKANLRVATEPQNHQNQPEVRKNSRTSKYRGVSWHRTARKWIVQGALNGERYYLGLYTDEQEAADVAARWREEHMPYANN